ncbi:MAG TPA: hypothetical protein VF678_12815 [bacterium]
MGALLLGTMATTAKAEDAPIMTYGVDIVSDYVVRGVDQYKGAFAFHEKDDGPLNVSPAIQPSFTLFGGNGISLNVWMSFAVSDRSPDNDKGFAGLSKLDELDYTLAYDWSNKLGAFTAGIIAYTYIYDDKSGTVTQPEYFLKWAMPYGKSVSPYLAYYASPTSGGEYAEAGISAGEAVPWSLVAGAVPGGLKHVTGKVGYVMGDFTISASVAYRPNAALVGYPRMIPFDVDGSGTIEDGETKTLDKGKYLNFEGKEKDYPSTIAWLTLSYAGSVAAK